MILPFLFGLITGMRTMTVMMVLCWYSWLLQLDFRNTWAFWLASGVSVTVFTLCALGEYFVDVQPQTPSRRDPALMLARLFFGALVGSLASKAVREPPVGGVILGLIGATVGTRGGYRVRMWLAHKFGRDLPAGLLESAVALCLAIGSVHLLHRDERENIIKDPMLYHDGLAIRQHNARDSGVVLEKAYVVPVLE